MIAGEDDRSVGAVSFRFRDGTQKNQVPLEQARLIIREAIESRSHAL